MSFPIDVTDAEGHKAQAVAATNATWDLLDGSELGAGQADDLLQRSYAAAYHWARAARSTLVNLTRASWLVSRAHATLGHGELALHHAERAAVHLHASADTAADFDHAYIHEASARAYACLGRDGEARAEQVKAAAVPLADDQDRAIFEADLAAEPWFGLPPR